MTTIRELEIKVSEIKEYLSTLRTNTPHYRDTRKHYKRLKAKLLKLRRKENE